MEEGARECRAEPFPQAVSLLQLILLTRFLTSLAAWLLADVDAMEVVGPEGRVAFGALPLACVVARLNALEAEDVEALCQHSILHPGVAARTRKTCL